MQNISVTRTNLRLLRDPQRVLVKPYLPGEEVLLPGQSRAGLLIERILAIPEPQVAALLAQISESFSHRHLDFHHILQRHFELGARLHPGLPELSQERQLLIGAYFTHEYSVEAAALFNPSIVLAPGPSDATTGERRVVLSLRAVGEGHISSIEFRSGWLGGPAGLRLDPLGPRVVAGHRTPPVRYAKQLFTEKLKELNGWNELAEAVLARLPDAFSGEALEHSLTELETSDAPHAIWYETAQIIRVLASSNYVVTFPNRSEISERILFPAGPNETRGMEDARFVQFIDGDTTTYFATYTAYDGFQIVPQLIQTDDFRTFQIGTLNGPAAQNKGMALFPRKINGKYVMLSRKDRENLFLATSTDVHHWNDCTELHRPSQPWELLQIGNCGSPIETEAGWLVLTHGVGAMRQYAIGAILLDLNEPGRVIGALREPLLFPDASEREGYVPNVLYTCGAIIDQDRLVVPYGFSDVGIAVALVSLPELLAALIASPVLVE